MSHVQAELREIYSIDFDLKHECPADPEFFEVRVDAEVGPKDSEGADRFTFVACSPQWIIAQLKENGQVWCRHRLIIERWDYELVRGVVQSLCARTSGESWEVVARRLSSYAQWEFEEFPPAKRISR